MNRRELLQAIAALTACPGVTWAQSAPSPSGMFSKEMLLSIARDVASRPFQERPKVPQEWLDMTYDQYKAIAFDIGHSIWSDTGSPVRLDLFPPGLYYPYPVEINLVEEGKVFTLGFDWSLFEKRPKVPELPITESLGYSGVRLRTEIEKAGRFDEFLVFQGASYFRAVARGLTYGLSARGLALNTASPEGEEFPEFTRFWVEKPEDNATEFKLHALMESPSVTGLYHFTVTAGEETLIDVRATLFPRADLVNVGIAPLTSMFFFDETNRSSHDDFRQAVHDSDGLSIWNGSGEMLWRPLANPANLQVSSFIDENPRGFGLAQRARSFSDYSDLEAHYQDRPSLWITPEGKWGKGVVTLVEIPTDKEIYDNIVAYWHPAAPLKAGQEHKFAYQMTWAGRLKELKPVARILNTRLGKGYPDSNRKVIAIDFANHPALPEKLEDLEIYLNSSKLTLSEGVLQRNPETGGPRLAFNFDPSETDQAEIRAQLFYKKQPVSEVWLYRWTT